MDQAVYNPWFMSTFVGGPLLVVAALVLHLGEDGTTLVLLVAAVLLAVATVEITAAVHLPLNKEIQDVASTLAATRVPHDPASRRGGSASTSSAVTSGGAFIAVAAALARTG